MTKGEKHRLTRKRNLERRTRRVLRMIRKNQYARPEDLKKDFVTVRIGEGAFRESYQIVGTSLLMKFPLVYKKLNKESDPGGEYFRTSHDGKYHTRSEVRKIRALRKYKSLASHVPPVYYYNAKHGTMVTKFYPECAKWLVESNLNFLLSKIVKELTGITLEDISGDNVKVDREKSRFVFVDLGY